MTIPNEQLLAWANQGAIVLSKQTHESIRFALSSDKSLVKNKNYEIYLQGSYKNSTNIRGDSDVDVVVEMMSAFSPDISNLSPQEKENYYQAYPNIASYGWRNFKADVLESLKAYYGDNAVIEGNKSLKIQSSSGRLSADIIPCIQHRKFTSFVDLTNNHYIDGIKFYTKDTNSPVVNYPKLHYEKGVEKNSDSRTNGWFKPSVRMIKNVRNKMIEQGLIRVGTAPSYFIENLLYNVPDNCFGGSYEKTYYNSVDWLLTADLKVLRCQNQQSYLFGNGSTCWDIDGAKELIEGLKNIWNGWR